MSIETDVKNILENHEYMPCLLIGKYVIEFKRQYKGKIFMVNSLENVRDIVSNYTGISDLGDKIFVMDGVGVLSEVGQSALLKFIEESKFPIVLLSYYDKVSPIILSRVKFTFKQAVCEVKNLKFMKLGDCLQMIEEKSKEAREKGEEFTNNDRTKFFAENCPIAYYFENRCSNKDYVTTKVNRIISKG